MKAFRCTGDHDYSARLFARRWGELRSPLSSVSKPETVGLESGFADRSLVRQPSESKHSFEDCSSRAASSFEAGVTDRHRTSKSMSARPLCVLAVKRVGRSRECTEGATSEERHVVSADVIAFHLLHAGTRATKTKPTAKRRLEMAWGALAARDRAGQDDVGLRGDMRTRSPSAAGEDSLQRPVPRQTSDNASRSSSRTQAEEMG